MPPKEGKGILHVFIATIRILKFCLANYPTLIKCINLSSGWYGILIPFHTQVYVKSMVHTVIIKIHMT